MYFFLILQLHGIRNSNLKLILNCLQNEKQSKKVECYFLTCEFSAGVPVTGFQSADAVSHLSPPY